jgi:uncharacterized membrane protein YvbJ
MTCLECGADSDGTTPDCTWCGAPVTDEPSVAADPAAEPVQVICPECGADSAEASDVCAQCGTLSSYQPAVAGDHAVAQQDSPALAVVLTAITILGAIALALVLWKLFGWQPMGGD